MTSDWARLLLIKQALMSTNHKVCKWCEKPLANNFEQRKAFHEHCLDEMLSELIKEKTDESETKEDDIEAPHETSKHRAKT
jgi:hypothetical protein